MSLATTPALEALNNVKSYFNRYHYQIGSPVDEWLKTIESALQPAPDEKPVAWPVIDASYMGRTANRGLVDLRIHNEGYALLECGATKVLMPYTLLHLTIGWIAAGCKGYDFVEMPGRVIDALSSIACEASLGRSPQPQPQSNVTNDAPTEDVFILWMAERYTRRASLTLVQAITQARETFREFLTDNGVKFGAESNAWDQSAANVVVDEEMSNWDADV